MSRGTDRPPSPPYPLLATRPPRRLSDCNCGFNAAGRDGRRRAKPESNSCMKCVRWNFLCGLQSEAFPGGKSSARIYEEFHPALT